MKTFLKEISTTLYAAWLAFCLGLFFQTGLTDLRFWGTLLPTVLLVSLFNRNRLDQQ